MSSAPCKNCGDRHLGCHSTCENYISWKGQIDEANKARRKEMYSVYPELYMGNWDYHRKIRKDRNR